jgi:hypothetical protein
VLSVTVTISPKRGFDFTVQAEAAQVYKPLSRLFTGVTANGSAAPAATTTTQLTLTFNEQFTGLNSSHIILEGIEPITKGMMYGSGTSFTLPISGFTEGGSLTVKVQMPALTIFGASSHTVTIHLGPPAVPTTIRFVERLKDGVTVEWPPAVGATSYRFYYAETQSSTGVLVAENVIGTPNQDGTWLTTTLKGEHFAYDKLGIIRIASSNSVGNSAPQTIWFVRYFNYYNTLFDTLLGDRVWVPEDDPTGAGRIRIQFGTFGGSFGGGDTASIHFRFYLNDDNTGYDTSNLRISSLHTNNKIEFSGTGDNDGSFDYELDDGVLTVSNFTLNFPHHDLDVERTAAAYNTRFIRRQP